MAVGAFKILLLLPDVWLFSINWLYYALCINSALIYTLSYKLRERTALVLETKDSTMRMA